MQSSSLRKKRKRRLVLRLVFLSLILAALIIVPTFLLSLPSIQVKEFSVSGATSIASGELIESVKNFSSGKYFYLIPRTNFIFFPKKTIKRNILDEYPRIENIDINLASLHSAELNIKERKPYAMFCDSAEAEHCYFLDRTGFIYSPGINANSKIYFLYRGVILGEPLKKYYLPENFSELNSLIDEIKNMGLPPESIRHLGGSEFELQVKGGKIIFRLEKNNDRIISNLDSILQDKDLSVLKDGELTVASIDLRYGNKAVLKKK